MEARNDVVKFNTSGDYYFLSNFYPYPLEGKSKKWTPLKIEYPKGSEQYWPTSEHLYQALKFKWDTAAEKEWCELIRKSNTPTIAKYLGHQFTCARYGWQSKYRALVKEYENKITYRGDPKDDNFRLKIMHITLTAKFEVPQLRKMLINTGNSELKEWSGDKFWGASEDNKSQDHLGKMLIQIRSSIKNT